MFLFEDGKIKVKPYKRICKAAFRKCYANQKKKKKPFNKKIYKNDTNLSTEYWKLSNLTHANPGV